MVAFDKQKHPECLWTFICRVTGLSIFQRSEWSNIKVGKNYWSEYSLVGDRILLSQPSGYADLASIQVALRLKDKVTAEIGQGKGTYIQIEDYSKLQGASLEARQCFISHIKNNRRLACLIFYGVSPLLRMSIKLGKRLNIVNFDVKIAEDYCEALNLALEILTRHNIDPGETFDDLKTQIRPLTTKAEKLRIFVCPDWELELDGFSLMFEVIDDIILHSISDGFFKASHIDALERTRLKVINAVSPEKGFEYIISNVKDLNGGSRRARRLYMDSLKRWYDNNPFKMYIFYGANSFMRAAAYLAKPFMPFKVVLADDFNHALEIIEKDCLRELGPHASQEAKEYFKAPFGSDQIQRCAEELIEYIGTINWEDTSGESNFVIHPNHPFKPVFEAIQLIKGELDDLFSERQRAEEALRKSEEKDRELFEKRSDILYLHDLEGNLLETNLAFKKEYGWDEDECSRLNIKDLIAERYKHQFDEYLARVIQNGHDSGLMKGLTKNGREIIVEYKTLLLTDSYGQPVNIKGYARDVTRQIQAEKEKQKLEDQLRQAYKMQAIGTLAGGIAHDFNNILSIILGYTELVKEDVPPSNPVQEYLNEIQTAAFRARDAVRQLLSFSHKFKQNLEPIKIDGIVKEALQFVRSLVPATMDIQKKIAQDVNPILADPVQIKQVLIHLCTNAIHAMEEKGGILGIDLKDVELDAAASKYHNLNPGRYVQLTVSDTGHGIDPEIRDRIFDPYFTTKEVGKGSGMGLAVVYGIVKSHKGVVTVNSEPDIGTTASVYFPAVETDTAS